jgi:hypothetical protein
MKINYDFSELEILRQIMGADMANFSIDTENTRETRSISFELKKGLEIDISQLDIVGGVYSFKGEQLVVHIYETRKEKGSVIDAPENNVRFHLTECQTIEKMRKNNRFECRYIGTNNTDSNFKVSVISDNSRNNEEEIETNLKVCMNCLKELNYKGYNNNRDVWQSFNLNEFFDHYKTHFKEKPKYSCENMPKNNYPDNWQEISRKMRIQKGWNCETCTINLEEHKQLLHVHHKNHAKFDCSSKNLEVVCIDCHSKKPGHNNMYISNDQMKVIRDLRDTKKIEKSDDNVNQNQNPEVQDRPCSVDTQKLYSNTVQKEDKHKFKEFILENLFPKTVKEGKPLSFLKPKESDGLSKIKKALSDFNREVIVKSFPNTDPSKRLLRPEMMDELLTHMPESNSEFLDSIPLNLRQCTDGTENRVFLNRVIEIVNER